MSVSEPDRANVFDAKGRKGADELNRKMAAYAAAATNATSLADLDGLTKKIENALNDPTNANEILDHYRTSATVPMSVLGPARAEVERKPSVAYTGVLEKRDKPKKTILTEATASSGDPEAARAAREHTERELRRVYHSFAVCGALWYSGLLSTVLSVLGWTEVITTIRRIEEGIVLDPNNKMEATKIVLKSRDITEENKATTRATTRGDEMRKILRSVVKSNKNKASFGTPRVFRVDAREKVLSNEEAEGRMSHGLKIDANKFTPHFLKEHIAAVALNCQYKDDGFTWTELQKLTRDEIIFRLVAYATACVLSVLTNHVAKCLLRAGHGDDTLDLTYGLISHHTAFPNTKSGVLQLLQQFEYMRTDASWKDALDKLARLESSGAFSSVLSKPKDDAPLPAPAFDLYMPGYNGFTNNAPTTDADKDDAMAKLLAALPKGQPPRRTITDRMSKDDKFQPALQSLIDALVEDTWNGVEASKEYTSAIESARKSVMGAKKVTLTASADAYLAELVRSMRGAEDTTTIQTVSKDGLLQAICYTLGDVSTEAHKDGLTNAKANHSMRRQILHELAETVVQKGSDSLTKFLAMTRELIANIEFKEKKQLAEAHEIYVAAKSLFPADDEDEEAKKKRDALFSLVGENLFSARKTIGAREVLFADEKVPVEHYDTILYNRLPSEFLEHTKGGTVLKLVAYEKQAAKMRSGDAQKRDLELKVEGIKKRHDEIEMLLKVGPEEIRAAAKPVLRPLVCGVLVAIQATISGTTEDHHRLFVHINDTSESKSVTSESKSQVKLLTLVKKAAQLLSGILTSDVKVVYGKDEWRDGLGLSQTTMQIKDRKFTVEGRNSIRPYAHEKDVLFVHRWPEYEFIPAPYASATPMFWRPPEGTYTEMTEAERQVLFARLHRGLIGVQKQTR
jgi:hypothetical protein